MQFRYCIRIPPDAPNSLFVMSDLKCVSLKKTLRKFYQFVSRPTRIRLWIFALGQVRTLWNHSLFLSRVLQIITVCLMPICKTVLKGKKVQTMKPVNLCSPCKKTLTALSGKCSSSPVMTWMNLQMLHAHVLLSANTIVPSKRVRKHTNNKPWVTKTNKSSI